MQQFLEYIKNRFIALHLVARYDYNEETKRMVLYLVADSQQYEVGAPYQDAILKTLRYRS